MARRRALDGVLPERVVRSKTVVVPGRRRSYADMLAGTGEKVQASTTTAFTRLLRNLLARSRARARASCRSSPTKRARSGIDALFREFKIYAPFGQQYEPVDAGLLLAYQEARNGQLLEEGITEAGAMALVHRGGHRVRHVGPADDPVLHLLFDVRVPAGRRPHLVLRRPARPRLPARRHRRPHDAARARGCSTATATATCSRRRCRTAAPTTPRSRTRSRVIVRDGIERMYGAEPEDCFYYLTLYNENYVRCRRCPRASRTASCAGCTATAARRAERTHRAQILASGPRCCAALEAQQTARRRSTTSPPTCGARRAASSCARTRSTCERWNRLHPDDDAAHAVRHRAARRRRRGRSSRSPTT